MTMDEYVRVAPMERIAANELSHNIHGLVKEKATTIKGFNKLSKTQQQAIKALVWEMFRCFAGDEYVYNHYDIFFSPTAMNPEYKKYRDMEDNNIFLANESSSTLRALEKRKFINVVEDGRECIDKISPLFTIDFSDIQMPN
jgi:hypothetical protein